MRDKGLEMRNCRARRKGVENGLVAPCPEKMAGRISPFRQKGPDGGAETTPGINSWIGPGSIWVSPGCFLSAFWVAPESENWRKQGSFRCLEVKKKYSHPETTQYAIPAGFGMPPSWPRKFAGRKAAWRSRVMIAAKAKIESREIAAMHWREIRVRP